MFFFEGYSLGSILTFIGVLAGLLLINELTRRSKVLSVIFYIIIPIVFTIFVWPRVANDTTQGNWFAWVKCYSALAGVVGFMALRYFKKLQTNKFMLMFPAGILFINIIEAVIRDFEIAGMTNVLENGLLLNGGIWNILNGIAGILCAITITGWFGIKIAKNKNQDMVWPDLQWFWVIAYGIWNFAYVYNCIPDRAFYAGAALILVSTFAAFFKSKGVWLQHRAQTLALWAMFTLTIPGYDQSNLFSITSTHLDAPKIILSIISILANIAVLIYEVRTVVKTKRNPLKQEIYTETKYYIDTLVANNL